MNNYNRIVSEKIDYFDHHMNVLTDIENQLATEPLSQVEEEAFRQRYTLRSYEKRFFIRQFHAITKYLGDRILSMELGEYKTELEQFARDTKSGLKGYKIFLLYRRLRSIRPKVVVEYGAGSSTAIITSILEKNAKDFGIEGFLYSFEQNPDYFKPIHRCFPDNLRKRVQLIPSPLAYQRNFGYRELFYEMSPRLLPENIDVIFIDGPGRARSMPVIESEDAIFSGDLRRLNAERLWKYAFTDIRYFNSMYFQNVLRDCKVKENITMRTIEVFRNATK